MADEKGYFTEEGLDYELNVEGSRKNTPRLAAVDSPIPLDDNRFGAFERYTEGHGLKARETEEHQFLLANASDPAHDLETLSGVCP